MRAPLSWLREYVPVAVSTAELAGRLSISSAEVKAIERRGVPDTDGNLGLFRVGRVLETGKHPNADRLQLCQVDVGEAEPRQIVCGAWNFGAGATVAVALPGAVLPGGRKLERAKLRGSVSDGMILSERELELGFDHSGILVLPDGDPGAPLADVLPLAEEVLDVETTGNRPDLLSIYGLAREVAALFHLELATPPGRDPSPAPSRGVDVRVDDPAGCPRYIGRAFRDVRVAVSPPWLRARLTAAGMRSISNVVDVTNYVMLALGNPLHAFDRVKLRGDRIIVRRAQPDEKIETLDGTVRALDPEDLVIADAQGPVAIAGIMGSLPSEVDAATTDVVLEAANFEPIGLLRSSERLRLRTEGSNRWEKGVDPYLAGQAAALATEMITELTGASWVGQVDVCAQLPDRPVIGFRPERAEELVGVELPPEGQRELLGRFGFEVAPDWAVTVPTWRARDVTREIDLVEEIARVRLDDVPFTLPLRRVMFGRLTREARLRRRVEDVLVGLGYAEAYTPSLVPAESDPDGLTLPEPTTAEQATLRTSLLSGLVDAARRNLDLGSRSMALFEIARVYLPRAGELPQERLQVAGVTEGGFGRAKGTVEALYAALKAEPSFEPAPHALMHRGKAARVGEGWVGELHPSLLEGGWGAFDLDLAELLAAAREPVRYVDVITFPALRRDLSLVVEEGVAAGQLVAAAREAAGPELREVDVVDVYRGPQAGPSRKSVTLALAFQSAERTLTDEEAGDLVARVVAAAERRLGASLRA